MHIFTENSILDCIEALRDGRGIETEQISIFTRGSVSGKHRVFVHFGDKEDSTLILVSDDAIATSTKDSRTLERLLQRVHRVARAFGTPPVSLPQTWGKYQYDNRISFHALPISIQKIPLRWVAEHRQKLVVFWDLLPIDHMIQDYYPDESKIEGAEHTWMTARASYLKNIQSAPTHLRVQPIVDLNVVGASAISQDLPYSQWMDNKLDQKQIAILNYELQQTLKIRGIAGTGKTLILQLKALCEIYKDPKQHILYLTHSWALADTVSRSLSMIDDRSMATAIDVFPLMMLRDLLGHPLPEGVEIVGEDGLDGRKRQIEIVSAIIDDMRNSDWPTYRDGVSEIIAQGVEGEEPGARMKLAWMLIREFAEVMDSHQIKPGMNSLDRYMKIPRADWMVELRSSADKEFFYGVFRRFVLRLSEEGQLTTDQAIDDLRRYLESYAWNIRRATDGYDLILVDEFHLFSDSERYLLHFLTRNPALPPRLILALDPRQSPFVLLTGMKDKAISRKPASSDIEVEQVELYTIHRFSYSIFRLVQLIQKMHPAMLDEGDDWTLRLEDILVQKAAGPTPQIHIMDSREDAVVTALEEAAKMSQELQDRRERVALIAAGAEEFGMIDESKLHGKFTVLRSRDDVEQLNYSRKSIVLSTSADCAGLQFTHVVALAFAGREQAFGGGTGARRAALTEVYLGVSRAESVLSIVTTKGEGAISDIFERALTDGIVKKG